MDVRTAVTGIRDPDTARAAQLIALRLEGLAFKPSEFTTGAQFGVDTLAAKLAWELWPDALHRVVVPAHKHNERVVAWMRENAAAEGRRVQIVPMDKGTTYLHRNERMLDYAELLIAFPKTSQEVLRSGTWHCIRQARERGIHILAWPLNDEKGWIE